MIDGDGGRVGGEDRERERERERKERKSDDGIESERGRESE